MTKFASVSIGSSTEIIAFVGVARFHFRFHCQQPVLEVEETPHTQPIEPPQQIVLVSRRSAHECCQIAIAIDPAGRFPRWGWHRWKCFVVTMKECLDAF
jgi:hypothetical protein